jgi:hypothetical protein
MKCSYCGESYDLGPPKGTLFVFYPHGEYRYWAHVRESKRHQWLLTVMARIVHQQMVEVGPILKEAKRVRTNERARLRRLEKKNK